MVEEQEYEHEDEDGAGEGEEDRCGREQEGVEGLGIEEA